MMPFTGRIERAPFHRARSASKKGTWSLPSYLSEAARCASTEDNQAPSLPLLREQGISTGVIPPLDRGASASKKDGLAAPLSNIGR
jgi:hypothetical protein